jgi:hypothetical protein
VNVPKGFTESIHITFEENYNWSTVFFTDILYEGHNLSLDSLKYQIKDAGVKGYMNFSGLNKSETISAWIPVHWPLYRSQQNQTHTLTVKAEIIYHNGTHHLKIILPAQIIVSAEAGDRPETAKEITEGEYIGFSDVESDPEDWYKIWIKNGRKIRIEIETLNLKLTSPHQDFELHLYDPNGKLVANATEEEIDYTPEELSYTANMTGHWHIQIVKVRAGDIGAYKLTITLTGEKR